MSDPTPVLRGLIVGSMLLHVLLTPVRGEPVFVDLSKVATTSLQDDAGADNGTGGWSDEGPNDMFVYPPIQFGDVTRNAHKFRLPQPATPTTPTVVMLRGQNRAKDKPVDVTVTVPDAKGKFMYLLMNGVGSVAGQPANYVVATVTVNYADGQTVDIPLRDGIEIRQWYTGSWWDNSGGAAWPFFMGRNLYSMKWRQYIGVWAMQWTNPRADQAIRSVKFTSAQKATPVIWAITIDDADYRADETALKTDFKRPDDVPEGFFDTKSDSEREAIYAIGLKIGHVQGIRRVDVLAPDLIAVTVDGALGKIGAGSGEKRIAPLTKPETFSLRPAGQSSATPIVPKQVGRQSYEIFQGNLPGFPGVTLYWHTFFLRLDQPLKTGSKYEVTVTGIDAPAKATETFSRINTRTPAIKVNQVGYSTVSKKRYAYLGYWAGDLGAVDYSAFKEFQVRVEMHPDLIVDVGPITLRKQADPLSGEDVYEMDLAALQPGKYFIVIPGLGRSDTFCVGGQAVHSLYYHTMRAFYHQRCGIALARPFTEFERPECHVKVYESGFLVGNKAYAPKPNEAIREYRGGYHDAGDDDVFTYHLRATSQVLDSFSRYTEKLSVEDLSLPESRNKIPDVLDEADWALRGYLNLQQADGAIPMGRGNDEDYIRNTYDNPRKPRPAFGILPPRDTSCTEYAAVAAQYARLVRKWDAKRADEYIASAEKALAWALANKDVNPEKEPHDRPAYLFRAWAAAELFETTGKPEYNELFKSLHREKRTTQVHWSLANLIGQMTWTYATSKRPEADAAIQKELQTRIIRSGDDNAKRTETNPYRMGHDGRALGWGNGNGGGHYGDPLLRAYWLTGDQKYLDAASLNADFLLGCNPLSRTFVTSVGARYPRQPQLSPTLYREPNKRGETVPGITNYGLANEQPPGYPAQVPAWRRVRDIGGGAEVSSEFTVTETLGASAMLFEALWGLEK